MVHASQLQHIRLILILRIRLIRLLRPILPVHHPAIRQLIVRNLAVPGIQEQNIVSFQSRPILLLHIQLVQLQLAHPASGGMA